MNPLFPTFHSIQFLGRVLSFNKPALMGILNCTPDSFFEDSRVNSQQSVVEKAEKMVHAGAMILDVGGHSTRPNADPVTMEEEITRVIPVIKLLVKNFPEIWISIDTYRLEVAQQAFLAGAHIFNDIGAGNMDEGILEWVSNNQIPYILSHSRGKFDEVHSLPNYLNVVEDVWTDLAKKVQFLRSKSFTNLIIDPGFGFSKCLDDNYKIMAQLPQFKELGAPLLVGISRKTMLCKFLNISSEEALNATTAMNSIALLLGADILRVHDVEEAKQVIDLVEKLKEYGLSNLS